MIFFFLFAACYSHEESTWTCITEDSFYGTYEYCCHEEDGKEICSLEGMDFFCIHNDDNSFDCCGPESGDCWVIQ